MSNPPTEPSAVDLLELRKATAEAMGWTSLRIEVQQVFGHTTGPSRAYGVPPNAGLSLREVPDYPGDPVATAQAEQWLLERGYRIATESVIGANGKPYHDVMIWERLGCYCLANAAAETRGIAVCRALVAVVEWEGKQKDG